jgi:FkbM family methyltransferase
MTSGLLSLAARVARWLPESARMALYRLGPISRGLRGALNRVAPHGVHPVQVAAGDLAGRWLLLDLQVDKDLWLGTYEPDLAAEIRHLARAGGVVYDLGANVGYTALLLAQAVGAEGRVIAFEPLPSNVGRLKQAVSLNRLESTIEIVEAAAGEADGPGEFRIHASGSMGRLEEGAPEPGGVDKILVDVIRLDSFVYGQHRPAPTLIKVDLEGGEAAAIRGMVRVLNEARPVMLIELHGAAATTEVFAELQRAGYQAWTLGAAPSLLKTPALPRGSKHIIGRAMERRLG